MAKLRIVIISDTHGLHERISIPDGDILVHAGDLTSKGDLADIAEFNEFLGRLAHPHKIVIAGNHDFAFERSPQAARECLTNATYLEDTAVVLCGIKFYGSPWQPRFFDWAFNLDRGAPLKRKWDMIPDDTDVLMTHGPPAGYGDTTRGGMAVGCTDLARAVERIQPRLHIFGHIHEGYGSRTVGNTTYINASTCDLQYRPVNPPVIYEWSEGE